MKATYYQPRSRVVVLVPDDPHAHERGEVVGTRNVRGEMEHRVQFADGATADYYADQLAGAEGTPSPKQR